MGTNLEYVRADDHVRCLIYPMTGSSVVERELTELLKKVSSFIDQQSENYLWHKDDLKLNKVVQPEHDRPHLHGVVHFGENIDDEWFVVHLLKRISEDFDVAIRTIDADGEFLLIEAANHLSKWMNPDSCDRRVYLHKGVVRVVPTDVLPKIVHTDAIVTYLNSSPRVTEVERNITNCIEERLKKYSDNLQELLHRSRAYLPVKVAALLNAKPDLISPAVTAFYQRDAIDTKICRKMEHFPPQDVVLSLVTFTKFSYAMISQDKSNPERNLWTFPPISDPQYKEHLLGYKITRGFEILASKCRKNTESDLTLSKKWNQYLQTLKRKGYFKDLLEHSKEYVELEKKARIYFLDNVGVEEASSSNILDLLQTIKYDVDELKQNAVSVPPSDDEKWMEVTEDQFNKLLEDRFGLKGLDATNTPNALSSAINKFLHQASDVEGIEIEKDDISSQMNEMDVDEEASGDIAFNPEDFLASVNQILMDLNEGRVPNENFCKDYSNLDDYSTEEEDGSEDLDMVSYMSLMDKEVENSTLSKSFSNPSEESSVEPVDIDVSAMANILKSYEEQLGGSGPAGNILHSMGLKLNTKKKM